jgi:hypothetical protein
MESKAWQNQPRLGGSSTVFDIRMTRLNAIELLIGSRSQLGLIYVAVTHHDETQQEQHRILDILLRRIQETRLWNKTCK